MLPVLVVFRTYCYMLEISYTIIYNIIGVNYIKRVKLKKQNLRSI